MIDIRESRLYHLVINGRRVDWRDYFRAAAYTFFQGKKPLCFSSREGKTVQIDLTQDMETIMNGIKSNFRNEIRRASREGIVFDESMTVADFVDYYNDFADKRGLKRISQKAVTKYPKFYILTARYGEQVLSAHVSFTDEEDKKVFLLFSASNRLDEGIDKKMVGFANKFLHYEEFRYFKDAGYAVYDFSGFSDDPNDTEKYGIGQFKTSFGGVVVPTKHYYSPLFKLANRIMRR